MTAAVRVILLGHHKYLPTVDRLVEQFNAADFKAEKRFSSTTRMPKTLRASTQAFDFRKINK